MRPYRHTPQGAVVLSRCLDLAPRIAHRTPRALLAAEISETGVSALLAAQGVALLNSERLLEVAREVSRAAAEARLWVAFVKGAALYLTKRVPPSARAASDIDVLIAPEDSLRAVHLMERLGFRPDLGSPPCDHQLPPLHRQEGEVVELHLFLPGVRLPGQRAFLGLDALRDEGLLEPIPGMGEVAFAPRAAVLVAHALVHGIAQHGFAPQSYPLMRMLADLCDLGIGEDSSRPAWATAISLTRDFVSSEEASATWDLCSRIRAEDPLEAVLKGGGAAEALLAHIVAGAQDPSYRRGLKMRALGSTPSLLPFPLSLARDVARSLWPPRAQLLALHPGKASPLSRATSRVARPLLQARRAFESWRSARASRRAKPSVGVESWGKHR